MTYPQRVGGRYALKREIELRNGKNVNNRIVKSLDVECGKETFKLNKGTHTFITDEVLTSAYEYNGGRYALCATFVCSYGERVSG